MESILVAVDGSACAMNAWGFRRMILGSVAESVARRSTVPVLLVREKKE